MLIKEGFLMPHPVRKIFPVNSLKMTSEPEHKAPLDKAPVAPDRNGASVSPPDAHNGSNGVRQIDLTKEFIRVSITNIQPGHTARLDEARKDERPAIPPKSVHYVF